MQCQVTFVKMQLSYPERSLPELGRSAEKLYTDKHDLIVNKLVRSLL